MNQKVSSKIFTLEGEHAHPLSVRAKAFVFHDPKSQKLLEMTERLAPSDAPILIQGETGTGKELIARHIHLLSGRKGPFLAVNCGAINDQLAESELFGHEAGSFTGATGQRKGWFESANGGTLFLDEIGDLPLFLQVKLLRVLQEGEVTRVGARQAIPINVRLITATNIDLDQAVIAETFRQDLLFRINTAILVLNPLRDRKGDILPLFQYFIQQYQKKYQHNKKLELSAVAQVELLDYPWPGNIRELENIAHYAVLMTETSVIQTEHLKFNRHLKTIQQVDSGSLNTTNHIHIEDQNAAINHTSSFEIIEQQLKYIFSNAQDHSHIELWNRLERILISTAFSSSFYNQVKTSQLLGISRNMVRTLLKRHQIISNKTSEFIE